MSYGRNFYFLVTPRSGERAGRYYNDEGAALPIGVPVVSTGNDDGLGRKGLELAGAAAAKPLPGLGGIVVYEYIQKNIGVDPVMVTYSDFDTAPIGAAVQLVSGTTVKIGLKNTTADTFLTRTNYPTPRVMVAGMGATPTLAVDDMLTTGTGNDTAGYWAKTTDPDKAWLIVTALNATTGVVEARLNF
jgi:hypothetical protein